jgi:hypothetical protein
VRMNSDRVNRRQFMVAGAAAGLQLQAQPPKKRIAAVITMYTQDGGFYSHAAVIIGRLLEGYSPNGVFTQPRTQLVSMYTAQTPPTDRSRGLARKTGFTIYPTIKDTLTLGGTILLSMACVSLGSMAITHTVTGASIFIPDTN